MGLLSWIILGTVGGWIASAILQRESGAGLVANVIVGLVGAAVGGFLANLVGRDPVFGFTLTGLFVAVLGTIVFLAVFSAVRRP